MKCDFKVGDKVIRADGLSGEIVFCGFRRCCKSKSYLEIHIKYEDGTDDYISYDDIQRNFDRFYQIGDRIYGNSFLDGLIDHQTTLKEELQEINRRIAVMQSLKEKKDGE